MNKSLVDVSSLHAVERHLIQKLSEENRRLIQRNNHLEHRIMSLTNDKTVEHSSKVAYKGRLSASEGRNRQLENELKRLEQEMQKQERRILEMDGIHSEKMKERDAMIADLKRELVLNGTKTESMKEHHMRLENEFMRQKAILKGEIARLSLQNDDYLRELQRFRVDKAISLNYEAKLEKKDNIIAQLKKKLSQIQVDHSNISQTYLPLQRENKSQKAEIKKMKKKISTLEHEVHRQHAHIQRMKSSTSLVASSSVDSLTSQAKTSTKSSSGRKSQSRNSNPNETTGNERTASKIKRRTPSSSHTAPFSERHSAQSHYSESSRRVKKPEDQFHLDS